MPKRSSSKSQSETANSLELALNSFVRRTDNTKELKEVIEANGGDIKRKGRSRNWSLFIHLDHRKELIDQIYQANEPSWLWVAKQLADLEISYQIEDLLKIAKSKAGITVHELVKLTGCTLADARRAIDELEWL